MQLDAATYSQVGSIIYNPPPTGKYTALKKAVVKVFTESETKRMQSLIDGLQLGDKKPSTLLAEMRHLSRGQSMDDTIFRQLWMNRLPPRVTSVLGAMTKTLNASLPAPTIEQLAEAADSIIEHTKTSTNINAVSYASTKPANNADDLTAAIARLNKEMETLTKELNGQSNDGHQSRSKSRSRSHSRTRASSVTASKSEDNVQKRKEPCGPHRKYGEGAHKNHRCYKNCPLYEDWCKANKVDPKNE